MITRNMRFVFIVLRAFRYIFKRLFPSALNTVSCDTLSSKKDRVDVKRKNNNIKLRYRKNLKNEVERRECAKSICL